MKHSSSDGFSIIEMVMAIVVSAIMAIGIVDYIGRAVDGIATSTSRNQLATAGRVALDRMGLELHNALPNSIRTSTPISGDQCIEFVPIRAVTSYLDPPFGAGGGTVFNVVDFSPIQVGATGVYAAIYPDKIKDIYEGGTVVPYDDFPFRGPIEKISSIADTGPSSDASVITLTASHRFRKQSPHLRFFLIEMPVSFCVKGSKLYRYENYGFLENQPYVESACTNPGWTPAGCGLPAYPSTSKILITDNIDNVGLTAFAASAQSLTRNALVSFDFKFSSNGDSIEISHESMSRSVP